MLPLTILSRCWDTLIKPVVVVIAAIGALLINFIVDFADQKLSTPTVTVKIEKGDNEFLIGAITSNPLELLAIDLPVLGKIKNVHDNNSVTDARTSIKKIVGSNAPMSQNNIEIYIENIKPKINLEFKVLYEPVLQDIFVAGTDRHKISYSWHHGGEQKTHIKWISLKTGQEVEKLNVVVKGARIFN